MQTLPLYLLALLWISCGDHNSKKNAGFDNPSPDAMGQSTDPDKSISEGAGEKPAPPPSPNTEKPLTPKPLETPTTVWTLSLSDSTHPREHDKLIGVQIRPRLVTGNLFRKPFLAAICEDKTLLEAPFAISPDSFGTLLQPSLNLPKDRICPSEIKITVQLHGITVDIGDVIVSDVIGGPAS